VKNTSETSSAGIGAETRLVDKSGIALNAIHPVAPVLHDRKTVAEATQVSPRTVDNWVRRGMPHLKLSPRMVRFDLGEVLGWIRSNYGTRR
jgi:predicted DNA-binding transcriptional regulator AlpA